jgi:hypothetical protein
MMAGKLWFMKLAQEELLVRLVRLVHLVLAEALGILEINFQVLA